MSSGIIGAVFVLTGLLNAYPAIGMFGPLQLRELYGLDFSDPDLLTLMQHRAVMLGLIGAFLIAAAFRRELQPAAFMLGFVSMLSFVVFAWLQHDPNPFIGRVMLADVIGSALLFVALMVYLFRGWNGW